MTIYNTHIQKQNEIIRIVANSIGFHHFVLGDIPSLEDYNEELSKYVWTINLMDLKNMES